MSFSGKIDYYKVFQSIISVYFIYIFILIFGYLLRILYAKSLTMHDFGLLYSLLSVFAFGNIFVDFGFSDAFRYYASKALAKNNKREIRRLFWNTFINQILILLFVTSLFIYLANYIAKYFLRYPEATFIVMLFTFYFFFDNLLLGARNLFAIYDDQAISYLIDLIKLIFLVSFTVLFIKINMISLFTFVFLWVIFGSFSFLFTLFIIYKKYHFVFQNINFSFDKKLIHFAKHSLWSNINTIFYQRIDMVIITYFLGVEYSGIYSNALSVIALITLFLSPLNVFIIPLISRINYIKEKNRFYSILNLLYHFGFFIISPIVISLAIFSKEIILVMFGEKYLAAAHLIVLFSFFLIFKGFYSYNLNILSGIGKVRERAYLLFFVMIFNVIFDLFVIKKFGMSGIAFVTGLSWMMIFLFSYYLIYKYTNYKLGLFWILKLLLNILIFTLSLLFFKHINSPSFFSYFFSFVFSSLFYFVLGYVLGALPLSEINFLLKSLKKMKNRIPL